MVMGGDSCSKGCEFESRHRILDGHFTFICCKKCYCVCKNENKCKSGRGWPILKNKQLFEFLKIVYDINSRFEL